MDQQIQASNSLQVVQANTRLAEKKLKDILLELQELQKSKTDAFKQYDAQIQRKKEEIEVLTEEGKDKSRLCRLYSQTLEELIADKERVDEELKVAIQAAKDAVKSIHEEAVNRERAVKDREENVEGKEEIAMLREENAEVWEDEVSSREDANFKKEAELGIEKVKVDKSIAQAKQTLAQTKELIDDITRQLSQKRMELTGINITIDLKQKTAEAIGREEAERLEAVKRREKMVARKEQAQNEKDEEQTNKEIWLNDREDTVGRAYRETLSRGGKVN